MAYAVTIPRQPSPNFISVIVVPLVGDTVLVFVRVDNLEVDHASMTTGGAAVSLSAILHIVSAAHASSGGAPILARYGFCHSLSQPLLLILRLP
jgi:hypothetical protein